MTTPAPDGCHVPIPSKVARDRAGASDVSSVSQWRSPRGPTDASSLSSRPWADPIRTRPRPFRRRFAAPRRRTGRRDRPPAPGSCAPGPADSIVTLATNARIVRSPSACVSGHLSTGTADSEPETNDQQESQTHGHLFGLTIIVPTRSPRRRTECGCLARLPDRASSKLLSSSRSP